MKIGFPAVNRTPVELVFQRFAAAPCYAVYDTESGSMEVIDNHMRHSRHVSGMTGIHALSRLGVDTLVVGDISPEALTLAQAIGIDVSTGFFGTCGDAIAAVASGTISDIKPDVETASETPATFRFLNESHTFRGANVHYSDWDFLRPLKARNDSPLDWRYPSNYADGAYLLDVRVREMANVVAPVELEFGMFNRPPEDDPDRLERVTFGQYCRISSVGRYAHVALVTDMEVTTLEGTEGVWDWSRAHFEPFCLIKPFGQVPYPIEIEFSVDVFSWTESAGI